MKPFLAAPQVLIFHPHVTESSPGESLSFHLVLQRPHLDQAAPLRRERGSRDVGGEEFKSL